MADITAGPLGSQRLVQQLRYGATEHVGEAVLASVEISIIEDRLVGGLAAHLAAFMQAEHLASHEVTETFTDGTVVSWRIPRTTWAMFKYQHRRSWWFGWWCNWRPAKVKTHTQKVNFEATLTARWESYATYPWSTYVPLDRSVFGVHERMEVVTHDATAETRLGKRIGERD